MRYYIKQLLINPSGPQPYRNQRFTGLQLAHGLKTALTPIVDYDLRLDYEING